MTLSRLQALIARTVSQLPEAQDFALAGGGALVVLGIVDRPTEDLDYFATAPEAVDRLGPRRRTSARRARAGGRGSSNPAGIRSAPRH